MSLPQAAPNRPSNNPCAACTVRQRAVCGVLDDKELELLGQFARPAELETGSDLIFEGDDADSMFVVVAGALKLYKLLPDGRRQITGFLFAGDFLGLAFNTVYQYTAEALAPTRVCRLPRSRIETLLTRLPKLANRLLDQASTELAAAQDQMLLLGRKTAQERLASFLLNLSERAAARSQDPVMLDVPMSRGDIGTSSMTGS